MGAPQELRRLAREKIECGKLPCEEHPKTWGGNGRGSPCVVCEGIIASEQPELEVEVTTCGLVPVVLWFHVACHRAWLDECDQAPQARSA